MKGAADSNPCNTAGGKDELYRFAAAQPIFDYHCHLSAKEIYLNEPPENIARLWLYSDHYKWSLLRANGTLERLITGNAPDKEKFLAYASALPLAAGNPLYAWSHMELKEYFGISTELSPATAESIWDRTCALIRSGGFSPRELLVRSNVHTLYTSDDPTDTLKYHRLLAKDASFSPRVIPGFRPERAYDVSDVTAWREWLSALSGRTNINITCFGGLIRALLLRMDDFAACGCRTLDCSMEYLPMMQNGTDAHAVFKKALLGGYITPDEADALRLELLLSLARECSARGWAMLLHIGPVRHANTALSALAGADSGLDCMGARSSGAALVRFMDSLRCAGSLPKLVLFNLDPSEDGAFASAAAAFQDESFPSGVQLGAPWWMNDNRFGILSRIQLVAQSGLIGRWIGMLTDSRTPLSFVRHGYFRSLITASLIDAAQRGEAPADTAALKELIRRICFDNAKEFFEGQD